MSLKMSFELSKCDTLCKHFLLRHQSRKSPTPYAFILVKVIFPQMLPSSNLSKNQIDRLGDRLRKGDIGADDLRLIDSYRRSFNDAYEKVVGRIRVQLGLEPTGRPAKSTTSIIDKLQRESIRLSQMQDVAGCRLTVKDIIEQNEVVSQLQALFEKPTVVDRRETPSHGYRAIHVVVAESGKLIEVQIRTLLQHLWAELSEKLSDVIDKEIKYGRGPDAIATALATSSDGVRNLEICESLWQRIVLQDEEIQTLTRTAGLSEELNKEIIKLGDQREGLRNKLMEDRRRILEAMNVALEKIKNLKEMK